MVHAYGLTETTAPAPCARSRTPGQRCRSRLKVRQGVVRDPQATATAFRGGWFHPGDLGCAGRTATAQLLDRAKDTVISGDENISTIEVENALMSHPDVAVMVQG